MAGLQFLHLAKRDSVRGALQSHIDGRRRHVVAEPRQGLDPVVHLGANGAVITAEQAAAMIDEADAYIEQCRDIGRGVRGRKAQPVGAFMVAGLPRYADWDAWESLMRTEQRNLGLDERLPVPDTEEWTDLQREVSLTFFRDALMHLRDRGGTGSLVAYASVHQDEASPHMHCGLVMADRRGRLGWNRIRDRFADDGSGRPVRGRELMSRVQDVFHECVAAPWGLERGSQTGADGAVRRREPIDRDKAEEIRRKEHHVSTHVAWLREETERLGRMLDEAQAYAEKAFDERDAARKERDEWKRKAEHLTKRELDRQAAHQQRQQQGQKPQRGGR